jgi:hypothetical protein
MAINQRTEDRLVAAKDALDQRFVDVVSHAQHSSRSDPEKGCRIAKSRGALPSLRPSIIGEYAKLRGKLYAN